MRVSGIFEFYAYGVEIKLEVSLVAKSFIDSQQFAQEDHDVPAWLAEKKKAGRCYHKRFDGLNKTRDIWEIDRHLTKKEKNATKN